MKKVIIILVMLLGVTPANADVYVKVDANGNAIGGAIMCDAGTCGAGSQYSQLTLQAGEQYVLQGTGQAGIGNNNPNTQVKVDIPTNEWTVTRQVEVIPVEPVVINNQQVISYTVQTVETFTPATSPGNDRPRPVVSIPEPTPEPTPEPSSPPVDTTTATSTATSLGAGSSMVVLTLNARTSKTPVTALSNVIMATKSGVKVIKKENAKVLIRKKGKK
jgi:hypothetical protein